MGIVFRSLAQAAEGNGDFRQFFALLANRHPLAATRSRLAAATEKLAQGTPWHRAMREVHLLGGRDEAVLIAAERAGNLPWALREVAEAGERRRGYRLRAFLEFFSPVLIIVVGAIVACLFLAFFVPLIQLIEDLA